MVPAPVLGLLLVDFSKNRQKLEAGYIYDTELLGLGKDVPSLQFSV